MNTPVNVRLKDLTWQDYDSIILNFAYYRGKRGFTQQEVDDLLFWARNSVTPKALVDNVIGGYLIPDIEYDDDLTPQMTFRFKPVKKEKGRKRNEKIY